MTYSVALICPWLVFSYGGILSAYMRFKYPNVVDVALAASAPIYMTTFQGSERDSFFAAVTEVMVVFINCIGAINDWIFKCFHSYLVVLQHFLADLGCWTLKLLKEIVIIFSSQCQYKSQKTVEMKFFSTL